MIKTTVRSGLFLPVSDALKSVKVPTKSDDPRIHEIRALKKVLMTVCNRAAKLAQAVFDDERDAEQRRAQRGEIQFDEWMDMDGYITTKDGESPVPTPMPLTKMIQAITADETEEWSQPDDGIYDPPASTPTPNDGDPLAGFDFDDDEPGREHGVQEIPGGAEGSEAL
jgi:hypothetical protein